jgi:hypothetical protein
MARDKANTKAGVKFTRESAKEIADAVRIVKGGDRKQPGIGSAGQAYASSHYLSKTTAAWAKGTSQSLTLWTGEPGSEAAAGGETVTAWNKFANVKADKWVMLARANGSFYVVSAEC